MKPPLHILLTCLLSSVSLPASERVALVIGNDAYKNTVKLDNCVNDARAVSGALKNAGFTVVAAENATAEQMHEKLTEFQRQAAGCKVGLFFYAGHGMEDEGKNYLVPVDAALERKAQVSMQTLALEQVMEKMKVAKIPAKIVLLDCCRNMPLGRGWRATRGGGGMAGVDSALLPESTLVYFATAPGTEALDAGASGKHSPFTDGLLQKFKAPGIHALEALMQVEDVVHQQTNGRQRPKLFSDGETAVFRNFSFAVLRSGGEASALSPTHVKPSLAHQGPEAATKEQSFVNSLGMKFVPVEVGSEKKLLFSIWETRRQDYVAYANANSGVDAKWKSPVFEQTGEHPVVNVSYDDAVAFCAWLTKKEQAEKVIGEHDEYRLPTDVEWSFAVGIGDREDQKKLPKEKDAKLKDVYPWNGGKGTWPPSKVTGNYYQSLGRDEFIFTSPVGSFDGNGYGLRDLGGNVWEWCGSYYDGSSGPRVLRGGSWVDLDRVLLLSSYRFNFSPGHRNFSLGFRCVLVVSAR